MNAPVRVAPCLEPLILANVSRRRFLRAVRPRRARARRRPALGRRAADPPKYGADGMPNGWVDDPLAFVPSARTARSRSSATAPRWGRACAPACP